MNNTTAAQRHNARQDKIWETARIHQKRICVDTVRNPLKGLFLGGPSAAEAEKTLRERFGFTDAQIAALKS